MLLGAAERNLPKIIFILASVLLLGFLGAKSIWTHENRWSSVILEMYINRDYFNPFLQEYIPYYDKPLLSYWLVIIFAKIVGELNTFLLRLPSALSGLLAVWATYQLAHKLTASKQTAMTACAMLLSTFSFIFWARVGTADMMTLAGTVVAVYWFYRQQQQRDFLSYFIFFSIMAITSSCKGLLGFVLPCIAILPALFSHQAWRQHINIRSFLASVMVLAIYFSQFLLTQSDLGGEPLYITGLSRLFWENVMRFIQPWDHQGPVYLYVIFLPLYLLPWSLFAWPCCRYYWQSYAGQPQAIKQLLWMVILLFAFFTLSRGRRDYYILPVIPFVIILLAHWLTENQEKFGRWFKITFIGSTVLLAVNFLLIQPLYYGFGGVDVFADNLRNEATQQSNWSSWQILMLDARRRVAFYVQPAKSPHYCHLPSDEIESLTPEQIQQSCFYLQRFSNKQIIISREVYARRLEKILPEAEYKIVRTPWTLAERLRGKADPYNPIAYIPKRFYELGEARVDAS